MTLNLKELFERLEPWEQIQVEIDAEEQGVTIYALLAEIFREGVRHESMDAVFQPTDRQWKSH